MFILHFILSFYNDIRLEFAHGAAGAAAAAGFTEDVNLLSIFVLIDSINNL